jgi:hypothetical protein
MSDTTANAAATTELLRGRIQKLRRLLDSLSASMEHEVGPLVGTYFPGEIRSRLRVTHGLDQETSDVYRPGDEASQIDMRHLPATLSTHPLETVIALQQVRIKRFTHYSDTELILVLDLSLSMVTGAGGASARLRAGGPTVGDVHTGALSEFGPPEKAEPGDKLWGLYLATTLFLTLGERAGFVLRAICCNDNQAEMERAVHPRAFRFNTLNRVADTLVEAYKLAEFEPDGKEASALSSGLEAALEVRARSVVVVVSDFLDPVSQYRLLLLEVMARHHVVLIDVANWWEAAFPVPGAFWQGKRWLDDRNQIDAVSWRDAARRVEDGTRPQPLRADAIVAWNKEIKARRHELGQIAHRFGAGLCERFQDQTVKSAVPLANHHLGLVGK